MQYKLTLPLSESQISALNKGDSVLLTGVIYTARDAAHARMEGCIKSGQPLPLLLEETAIYYCGPTPARENEVIGSCGPTTSGRMDDYTPLLMDNGLKITIGKGPRNLSVVEAIKKHKGLYLTAVGGAAALLKSCVKKCEAVEYTDLGCEALHRLEVVDMPLLVSIDCRGQCL